MLSGKQHDLTNLLNNNASKFRELADGIEDSRDQFLDVLTIVLGQGNQCWRHSKLSKRLKEFKCFDL